jgi:molybdate transport system substrate-binding protein
VLARSDVPEVQIVGLPDELAVGADYGLIVRDGAAGDAWRLALFILAPEGQNVLADYGFTSGALPQKD